MLDRIRNQSGSLGTKIIFGLIIIVFVFWGVGNLGGMGSGVVAVVNGEKILLADYEKALNRSIEAELKRTPDLTSNEEQFTLFKQMVLEELIFARLRGQEARRLGILVTPHELKTQIASFSVFQNEQGKFDPELYTRILGAQNIKPGEFEAEYREDLLEAKLMRYVAAASGMSEAEAEMQYRFALERRVAEYVLFSAEEYAKNADLSEEEIAARYESGKERFRLPARAALEYLRLTPATLASGYPVDEAAAKDFYEANIASYAHPESFQARHILIQCPPEGSSEPEADKRIAQARVKAEELADRLKGGEDFRDVARLYSEDPESAENGGMLNWLAVGESGSKEFDEAALALEAGQVSGLVRSAYGFHIIRLEEKKAAYTTPFAEARAAIVRELAQRKADEDFTNVQDAAEKALAEGTPFSELAGKFRVEVASSGFKPQAELEKELGLHNESRQVFADAVAGAALGDGLGAAIFVPLYITDGIALVKITEARPSEIPPLEDVRESLANEIKAEKGLELARAAAKEALPLFAGGETPATYAGKVAQSKPVLRVFPVVEPLGPAPSLVEALYSSESKGEWLPDVFELPQGAVIARLVSVEPVTGENWNEYKGIYMAQYRERRQVEATEAFVLKLHQAAEIERSYDLLARLSFNRR